MAFKEKSTIMDRETIARSVTRIAHEILEKNKGSERLAIIGIRSRGAYLADRINAAIKKISKTKIPQGALDITLYRDDLRVHNTRL